MDKDTCYVVCGSPDVPPHARVESTHPANCDACGCDVVVADSTINAAKEAHAEVKLICQTCIRSLPNKHEINFNNLSDEQVLEISKKTGLSVEAIRDEANRLIDIMNQSVKYEQN